RTSGEYFFACLMTPISQELESPANPGRFTITHDERSRNPQAGEPIAIRERVQRQRDPGFSCQSEDGIHLGCVRNGEVDPRQALSIDLLYDVEDILAVQAVRD